MEVTFKLNPDDIQELQWHNFKTSPTLQRPYRTVFVCVPVLLACLTLLAVALGLDALFAAVFFVAFAGFWILGWPKAFRRNMNRTAQKLLREGRNAAMLYEHRLAIDEQGFSTNSKLGESRLSWEVVERIEATATHIYVYIGSLTAYVVPKWAFDSDQQAEQFLDAARRYKSRS